MEDSSPDLSLNLRGSNGSRDSYYIEFTQGIDSDIEIEEKVVVPSSSVTQPKTTDNDAKDDESPNDTDKSLNNLAPTLPPVPSDLEDR